MGSISLPTAIIGAGALSAGSSVLGAGASESAAATQAQAADQASAAQLQMFNTIRGDLAPYMAFGGQALNPLSYGLGLGGTQPTGGTLAGTAPGSLIAPFNPTMAQLQNTPGYQFTRQQGLQATQNSFAAQGLGASGAAAKGAANYAENLASTTYQQQFNNYWTNQNQALSGLQYAAGVGQSAANQTGAFGTTATQLSNNYLTSGAAASAAGTIGAANALTGGIGGVSNAALLYGLNQSGMFGGGSLSGYTGNVPGYSITGGEQLPGNFLTGG